MFINASGIFFLSTSVDALQQPRRPRAFCLPKTILIYEDCRICSCNRQGQPSCLKKSCDLRTKASGYCPPTILKESHYSECVTDDVITNHVGACQIDNDCPGKQLCCFDFCRGAICVDPAPLWDGKPHPGLGYPSLI
ncbi:unnamed protein product [Allacma fusca]|uniref:WAP domain-containing protein n=1 Tax=Allacma fusca TaxID=39272 RepID=A0A8J2KSM9_9HEXA|nr:unnamed protein product [Allacma fusca]